jgi:hypothetical protein
MQQSSKTILLITSIAPFYFSLAAFPQTNTPSAETFLPKATLTDAVYVQIEDDPRFEEHCRRMREAREKNPQWFVEYNKKNLEAGVTQAPYHENFGVSKEAYEYFSEQMNHFREIKRKEIKIRRSIQNSRLQLDFVGDDLLLTQLVLNPQDGTVKTPTDVLPKLEFVDLATATLPPARHRGPLFRTPDAKIAETRRRESLLIGELKDKDAGIIHYSVNTPGQVKRIYIQFPR